MVARDMRWQRMQRDTTEPASHRVTTIARAMTLRNSLKGLSSSRNSDLRGEHTFGETPGKRQRGNHEENSDHHNREQKDAVQVLEHGEFVPLLAGSQLCNRR